MADLLFILITVVFFVGTFAYVRLAARLVGSEDDIDAAPGTSTRSTAGANR